ncbi:MAG: cation diffusion facilitator family transporter [Acidimicrobiales bacterium]
MHLLEATATEDPFDPAPRPSDSEHRRAAHRAIGLSAAGLALTGAAELGIAVLSGSVGLLGDALHNLSDVSTSLVLFVGFRLSRRRPSRSHPYGYERAEDLAGLAVALVIWAGAVVAAIVSVHKLTEHGRTSHVGLGMAAAAIGIVGNQVVARYKRRVGHRIQSTALLADATHSWLDTLASAGALLGLVGVAAGLPWADGVAGLVVTVFVVHVGWEVTVALLSHLMDGVDPDLLARAEAAATGVAGVDHAHVRARWSGRSLLVDVEGYLVGDLSLAQAERVGRSVRSAVVAALPEIRAVRWSPRPLR